mgnify:CR=1 FL=1
MNRRDFIRLLPAGLLSPFVPTLPEPEKEQTITIHVEAVGVKTEPHTWVWKKAKP